MFDASRIRNVIFDFGGILFEIDYHLPVQAFQALGYDGFASVYTQSAQNEIFDQLETGKISNEAFLEYLHTFVPNATRAEVAHAWNCILLRIWPHKVDFVKSVRAKGYRTFMLSNTNAIHVAEFERMIDETMGIASFYEAFEKIYYSNAIGIKKPYPSTYLALCEWNGLKPEETLFIDDSIQHVRGAAAAGLIAVHLEPGETVEEKLAALVTSE